MKIQIKFGLNFRGDIRYVSRETKKDEVDSRMKRIRAENEIYDEDELEEKFYELKYDYEEKIEKFEEFVETADNLWEYLDHLYFLKKTLNLFGMFELFGLDPDIYDIFYELLDQVIRSRQAAYDLHATARFVLDEAKKNEEKFLSKYKKEV